MAGIGINISLDDTTAGRILGNLQSALGDLSPLMDDIGAELESSTLERFETNIGPDGAAWPQSLRAQTKGGPTLVDQGLLRDSVNYRLDGPSAVEVGAGGPAAAYAAIHQVGGTITAKTEKGLAFTLATGEHVNVQSVTLPARPYLGISDQDDAVILDIAIDYMAEAVASW